MIWHTQLSLSCLSVCRRFNAFDKLTDRFSVYKVETIGECTLPLSFKACIRVSSLLISHSNDALTTSHVAVVRAYLFIQLGGGSEGGQTSQAHLFPAHRTTKV